uniref:Uncharacterized protein n=1 Tax=Rhizophora mucronata TaxID=61149 RepID=A0A2P2P2C2_RHIMU
MEWFHIFAFYNAITENRDVEPKFWLQEIIRIEIVMLVYPWNFCYLYPFSLVSLSFPCFVGQWGWCGVSS